MEYLTFTDAMKYLGIKSPVTLKKYIANGLPVIKVDNSKKISKTAIDEFMRKHTVTSITND